MVRGRINWRVRIGVAGVLWGGLLAPSAATAQRLLDLPARAGGEPDALLGGPLAVFWNPGAARVPAGRGEAVLLNAQGPTATSLDGVAFAALFRLDERTAMGFGLRHIGLDEIPTTSTSPLPDDVEGTLDIGETTFSLAAARMMSADLAIGAGAHYTRASRTLEASDEVVVGAGFRYRGHDWTPGVGATARVGEGGTEWEAGLDLAPDRARVAGGSLDLGVGVSGSPRFQGLSHRVALGAAWGSRLRLSAGLAGEPGPSGRTWDPLVGLVVVLQRYSVGILREQLPNGIGAVHTFRFGVTF